MALLNKEEVQEDSPLSNNEKQSKLLKELKECTNTYLSKQERLITIMQDSMCEDSPQTRSISFNKKRDGNMSDLDADGTTRLLQDPKTSLEIS